MTRLLGTFTTDYQLRELACQLVLERIGFYADEIVRQQTTPGDQVLRVLRPKTVVAREEEIRFADEQLPAIIIATPGTEEAERDGSGRYGAAFRLEVHAIVQSTDEIVGGKVASILALAAVAALLNGLGGGLGNRVGKPTYLGQGATDDGARDRARHGSVQVLSVPVDALLEEAGPFPTELLPDPPRGQPALDAGDLPTVETVALTTTPVEEIDS